ncbi:MAG TPA: DNA-3-methyladenine glycosylase [Ktedonobacterales bacterium]|nr:DNA-3-methyladenine glycosylase [Ktedonobacterales bacterium]
MHARTDALTSRDESLTRALPREFYARATLEVARELLGKTLVRRTPQGITGGIIVETEGYVAAIDPAAHAYRGRTARTRTMFGPPGHAYVYRSYGLHSLLNVVVQPEGEAAAVLLRALQPTMALDLMQGRRGPAVTECDLCRGPGRLCLALDITLDDNGADLLGPNLWIAETPDFPADAPVATTPRIGITRATEWPWRFVLAGNRYVSGNAVPVTGR